MHALKYRGMDIEYAVSYLHNMDLKSQSILIFSHNF